MPQSRIFFALICLIAPSWSFSSFTCPGNASLRYFLSWSQVLGLQASEGNHLAPQDRSVRGRALQLRERRRLPPVRSRYLRAHHRNVLVPSLPFWNLPALERERELHLVPLRLLLPCRRPHRCLSVSQRHCSGRVFVRMPTVPCGDLRDIHGLCLHGLPSGSLLLCG